MDHLVLISIEVQSRHQLEKDTDGQKLDMDNVYADYKRTKYRYCFTTMYMTGKTGYVCSFTLVNRSKQARIANSSSHQLGMRLSLVITA